MSLHSSESLFFFRVRTISSMWTSVDEKPDFALMRGGTKDEQHAATEARGNRLAGVLSTIFSISNTIVKSNILAKVGGSKSQLYRTKHGKFNYRTP